MGQRGVLASGCVQVSGPGQHVADGRAELAAGWRRPACRGPRPAGRQPRHRDRRQQQATAEHQPGRCQQPQHRLTLLAPGSEPGRCGNRGSGRGHRVTADSCTAGAAVMWLICCESLPWSRVSTRPARGGVSGLWVTWTTVRPFMRVPSARLTWPVLSGSRCAVASSSSSSGASRRKARAIAIFCRWPATAAARARRAGCRSHRGGRR